jgi:hypothetical protein
MAMVLRQLVTVGLMDKWQAILVLHMVRGLLILLILTLIIGDISPVLFFDIHLLV